MVPQLRANSAYPSLISAIPAKARPSAKARSQPGSSMQCTAVVSMQCTAFFKPPSARASKGRSYIRKEHYLQHHVLCIRQMEQAHVLLTELIRQSTRLPSSPPPLVKWVTPKQHCNSLPPVEWLPPVLTLPYCSTHLMHLPELFHKPRAPLQVLPGHNHQGQRHTTLQQTQALTSKTPFP